MLPAGGACCLRAVSPATWAAALVATVCAAQPVRGAPGTPAAANSESPAQIVATAVREKGIVCDDPQDVAPDDAASEADRPAWIIRCGEQRFRVIFEGDTGPRVIPLRP